MNNDLISRSALGIGYANPLVFDDQSFVKGWNMAIEIITKAPAVDAVEVVRCKDCDHLTFLGKLPCCTKYDMREVVSMSDFCSYGERRNK